MYIYTHIFVHYVVFKYDICEYCIFLYIMLLIYNIKKKILFSLYNIKKYRYTLCNYICIKDKDILYYLVAHALYIFSNTFLFHKS